jgi:hypothetical protein
MHKCLDAPHWQKFVIRVFVAEWIIEPKTSEMVSVDNVDELEVAHAAVCDPKTLNRDEETDRSK